MQTVEDFKRAIEATFDNESAAQACFDIAKMMCIDFGEEIDEIGFFPSDKKEQDKIFEDWHKSRQ